MKSFYKSYFFALLAIIFGLFVSSTISRAYEVISDSGKTIQCNSPNPYDCIKVTKNKSGTFKDMPLNTNMLGWNGPFTADVRYNTELKWILDLGYFQQFTDSTAMALNLSGGFNEMRGNLTTGFLLGQRQLIKVTYEISCAIP